jgi:hypothetical protein
MFCTKGGRFSLIPVFPFSFACSQAAAEVQIQ